jgi:hypothetical protein
MEHGNGLIQRIALRVRVFFQDPTWILLDLKLELRVY